MAQKLKLAADILVHATEDADRITASAADVFGVEPDAFVSKTSLGHFGNPITTLTCTVHGREASDIISRLVRMLGAMAVSEIKSDIESRIADSALYIRLDKQALVQKKVMLDGDRAVKVRIGAAVYAGTDAARVFSDILQMH